MSTTANIAGRRPTRGRSRPTSDAFKAILRDPKPTELPHIVAASATETGQPPEVLTNLILVALRSFHGLPSITTGSYQVATPTRESTLHYLHAADTLIENLREFTAELKTACPDEMPSTEVRKNWAEILDRVHADDEIVYVTQHNRRVAALVPPHVAESFEADQAWFWTEDWQQREAEADQDIEAGRVTTFRSDEEFLDSLDIEDESD